MTEPLRTLIVDDEPAAVRRLVRLCAARPALAVVATAGDGAAALAVLADTPVDLILLDIEMPGMSGLALAERLVGRRPAPTIVFVTAFEQFALAAFAVDAVGYLLKPVDPVLFAATIERITSRIGPPTAPVAANAIFWAPYRGALLRLEGQDIDRITGEDDYARLHCGERSYLVAERLYAIERRLGDDRFVRVHRSTLINRDRIAALEPSEGGWAVRLRSGDQAAVGRSFLPKLRRQLGISG